MIDITMQTIQSGMLVIWYSRYQLKFGKVMYITKNGTPMVHIYLPEINSYCYLNGIPVIKPVRTWTIVVVPKLPINPELLKPSNTHHDNKNKSIS